MDTVASVLPAPLSQLLFTRFSQDKKETFVKLVVLSLAAILCKNNVTWLTVISSYVAFSTRLFAVLRFESVIHEFDP